MKILLTLKTWRRIFSVFRDQFSVNVNDVPEHLQLAITEFKCNAMLKNKFSSVDVGTFYQDVGPNYPEIKFGALKITSLFGNT